MTMPEIIKTDKLYRRNLFTIYLAVLVPCSLALWFGIPRLSVWFHAQDAGSMVFSYEILSVSFLCVFIIPACYLIVTGRRILWAKQFPWPGMKVIHDTVVITGSGAIRRGKMLIALGIVSIVMAILGSTVTMYLLAFLRNFFGM